MENSWQGEDRRKDARTRDRIDEIDRRVALVLDQSRRKEIRSQIWRIGAFVVVVLAIIGSNYANAYNHWEAQIAGCERGKLDRADNAASWTAHTKYILSVTQAASVKEDVKIAAREASKTHQRTSASLNSRAKIVCEDFYDKPSLFFGNL